MESRRIIKLNNKNWLNYFGDATKRMFGCEPEMLINFAPFIQLYVFDYGRLEQNKHYFKGCDLLPAKIVDKDGDIIEIANHVYMNFSLDIDEIEKEELDENLFLLKNKPELDEIHLFYNPSDPFSFYISEELITGMRVTDDYKEDMECRLAF